MPRQFTGTWRVNIWRIVWKGTMSPKVMMRKRGWNVIDIVQGWRRCRQNRAPSTDNFLFCRLDSNFWSQDFEASFTAAVPFALIDRIHLIPKYTGRKSLYALLRQLCALRTPRATYIKTLWRRRGSLRSIAKCRRKLLIREYRRSYAMELKKRNEASSSLLATGRKMLLSIFIISCWMWT